MRRAWQAAPVQTGLGLQTGALGGFGPEWEPTLHLNTVNTAKCGYCPPDPPSGEGQGDGEEAGAAQMCRHIQVRLPEITGEIA